MTATQDPPRRVDLSTRLMTKEEVADLLRVRPSTVADLARRQHGTLPSVRVGRRRLYVLADVEHWLAQHGR